MLKNYLIVNKDILPDFFEKVVQTRSDLNEKKYSSVSDACKANGISRSTYYKYKDSIFLPEENNAQRKAILSLSLLHETGSLSKVLRELSLLNVSILTISQSLPIAKKATVILSIDINNLDISLDDMIFRLKKTPGVQGAKILSVE